MTLKQIPGKNVQCGIYNGKGDVMHLKRMFDVFALEYDSFHL